MGKFGKEIQSNQIPGWSQYYLDYKGLKKIVSSLEASYSTSPDAPTTSLRPSDVLNSPSNVSRTPGQASLSASSATLEDERGPVFQAHKASFFFKLERELGKINTFYLQKEAELKTRLATLLSKRQAAAQRLQDALGEESNNTGAEWRAVEEGFRLLDNDLGKLQHFIEINATGFRKILKKWDKRSKSRTKELYLTRQVEIQPCFNRQLLSELSDTVAACLLDLSNPSALAMDWHSSPNISSGDRTADTVVSHVTGQGQAPPQSSAFRELETNLGKAIASKDDSAARQALVLAEQLLSQPNGTTHVTRILWKAAIEAEPSIADIIMASKGYDIHYIDDINGRTCLHGAAIAGELRLLNLCVQSGLNVDQSDFYGRSPLHYSAMHGHDVICRRLLELGADPRLLDKENYNPLIYAIVNRKVACVRVLLGDSRVGVEAVAGSSDLNPLLLACQFGPAEIPSLLLQRDAQKVPNSNGQFPLHLAARDGHADICRLLLTEAKGAGKDQPDKYSEWTPLFHAARYGHLSAVEVLLGAGCNPHTTDDAGMTAAFYAAWYGFIPCMDALLRAMASTSSSATSGAFKRSASVSPHSDILAPQSEDVDMIPSLSLPPPIMPLRIYGHNYLDKMHLLQVVLEASCTTSSAISPPSSQALLSPRDLLGTSAVGVEPSLKLVVAPKPDAAAAPHTLTLPLTTDLETLSFQVKSLKDLTLEFTFYPTFGSKPIGKAVALPGALFEKEARQDDGGKLITLPILDHRLHVIGQITFAACVIHPFHGAKLEVGGSIETYWKSTAATPTTTPTARLPSRLLFGNAPSRSISGIPNPAITGSPTVRPSTSATSTLPSGVSSVVFSSLSGEYIHVIVQVTRDGFPVVCPSYKLPVDGLDMGVADLTVEQFLKLAQTNKTELPPGLSGKDLSSSEWKKVLRQTTTTLGNLLKVLPVKHGLCLELAYPARFIRRHYSIGRGHQVNDFVDSVLQITFGGSATSTAAVKSHLSIPRRKIVFASFEPSVCVAVNWKQPNYAVFFASNCGSESASGLDNAPIPNRPTADVHCRSLDAAINFAKANNILGVMVAASLLTRVPSLIAAVKDSGVLVAAFGSKDQTALLTSLIQPVVDGATPNTIDAVLQDGVLSYIDHGPRPAA
ncbi:phosphate system positive regulatory protein pho81 [Tulasnella sp. 427]|nr:phosphate system positive regulatory protein pho81 [Tulasnella sp. 427]